MALDYARLADYLDDPAPDPSAEDRIGADIQEQVRQARRADQRLHRRLEASLSPEQRRRMYERVRQRKLG